MSKLDKIIEALDNFGNEDDGSPVMDKYEAKQKIKDLMLELLPTRKDYVTSDEQDDAATENYGRNCWNACIDEISKEIKAL